MSNVQDPSIYVVSRTPSASLTRAYITYQPLLADAHHRFVAEECDWGFTRFHDLRKLYNAQDHQKRPIIEDDTAEVTVFVRVLKDPTGVLWHNFQKCVSELALVPFFNSRLL